MNPGPRIAVKLLSGGMAGLIKEFDTSRPVLIGRDAAADLRLHPTEDATVGRQHARLTFAAGRWQLEPLHRSGVLLSGAPLGPMTPVFDNQVYQLGPGGPEFRVSILDEAAPETVAGADISDHLSAPRPALRRAEYDPAAVEATMQRHSRRALRVALPAVGAVALLAGAAVFLLVPGESPPHVSAALVHQQFGPSVFRAAGTVRFRCPHPDVAVEAWRRYWYQHGTGFAVGSAEGWVYALTNHHVFGHDMAPDVSLPGARESIAERSVLTRWPRDFPKFAARLAEFDARLAEVDANDTAQRTRVAEERYTYLAEVVAACTFDEEDAAWRQVVLDGVFVPAEVVDFAAEADLVLFRFRPPPGRSVAPLPLRAVTAADQAGLSGQAVFILGFPGVGDLPLKGSTEAMAGAPDINQGVLSNIKVDDRHGGFSIQSSAPINQGNSGGPLFDARGGVIGINTWGPSKAEAEGVSYSIALGPALAMLEKHGIAVHAAGGGSADASVGR